MPQAALHDGTLVDTSSEEWRHECEARTILNMRGLARRQDFLATVEKRRGEAERLRLQKTMMALWQRRRQHETSSA